MRRASAEGAVAWLQSQNGFEASLGFGVGTTVVCLIQLLDERKLLPNRAVCAGLATARQLNACGVDVIAGSEGIATDFYIDGADWLDTQFRLIKGAGGAMTREKIIAQNSKMFVCIAATNKLISDQDGLDGKDVPIAVLPIATRGVERDLLDAGLCCKWRAGQITQDGHCLADVGGLSLKDPLATERWLASIPGIVENGIFAQRGADVLCLGESDGSHKISQRAA